jgi:hypothetical protein
MFLDKKIKKFYCLKTLVTMLLKLSARKLYYIYSKKNYFTCFHNILKTLKTPRDISQYSWQKLEAAEEFLRALLFFFFFFLLSSSCVFFKT